MNDDMPYADLVKVFAFWLAIVCVGVLLVQLFGG